MSGLAVLQATVLLLFVWGLFRLVPSIPAGAKAWVWRITLLKPLVGLVPLAVVTLYVLPAGGSAPQALAPEAPFQNPHASSPPPTALRFVARGEDSEPGLSIDPFLALWFLGALGVAGFGVVGSLRVVRVARRAQVVTDPSLLATLGELTERAGLGPVRMLSSDEVESPVLVGATIVLPSSALERALWPDTRLMLAHEVAHIARRDLFWFGALWVVQALFFFNPMVWVAARCSRLDHESATDRYAAELADVPVPTYAGMLLRATVAPRSSLVPGILPMAESYRTIHRRLEAMKHFNSQPSTWRKMALGALALATAGLIPMYQLAEALPMPQQGGGVIVSTGEARIRPGTLTTTAKKPASRKIASKGKAKQGTLTTTKSGTGKGKTTTISSGSMTGKAKAGLTMSSGTVGMAGQGGRISVAGGSPGSTAGSGINGQGLTTSSGGTAVVSGQGGRTTVSGNGVGTAVGQGGRSLGGGSEGGVAVSGQGSPGLGGGVAAGGGQGGSGLGGGVAVGGGQGGSVGGQGVGASAGEGGRSLGGGSAGGVAVSGEGSPGFGGGASVSGRPSGSVNGQGVGFGGGVPGAPVETVGWITLVPNKGETIVSCDFSNYDVREALLQLFHLMKVNYTIDTEVQGVIALSCRNVTMKGTLEMMLRQVGATYRVVNKKYVVTSLKGKRA